VTRIYGNPVKIKPPKCKQQPDNDQNAALQDDQGTDDEVDDEKGKIKDGKQDHVPNLVLAVDQHEFEDLLDDQWQQQLEQGAAGIEKIRDNEAFHSRKQWLHEDEQNDDQRHNEHEEVNAEEANCDDDTEHPE
jgi:hypothetical protein